MRNTLTVILPLGLALACLSCGEDPAKVEKREKQKAEIVRLKGEIAVLEERAKNMPHDVSDELAKTRKEVESLGEEVSALDKEIATLKAKKLAMQAEFDKYRAKYPVN